jgi:hypothetical protein
VKKILQLLLLLTSFLVPSAYGQVTKISGLPSTNTVNGQDNLILNSTNNGLGTYITTRTTAQSLYNTLLGQSNSWPGGVGQFYGGSQWHSSVYLTQTNLGLFTLAGFSSVLTSSAGAMAGWPGIGVQFNEPVGGVHQYWVHYTNSPTQASVGPTGAFGFTNQNITVQFPQEIFYDSTPGGHNTVAYVAEDGTIGTATGTFGLNGAFGGGFRLEDGADSMQMKMLNAGGIFGEMWEVTSDNNNLNPIFMVSPFAPNYSAAVLPNGVGDFEQGLSNDLGNLAILSGLTVTGNQTNSGTLGAAGNFGVGGTSQFTGNVVLKAQLNVAGNVISAGLGNFSNNVAIFGINGGTGPQLQLLPVGTGKNGFQLSTAESADGLPALADFFVNGKDGPGITLICDDTTGIWTFKYPAQFTTIATTGTNGGVITATGWTNTSGTNIIVNAFGTGNVILKNNAGIPWATNGIINTGSQYFLQPNESFTGSGLSGTYKSF